MAPADDQEESGPLGDEAAPSPFVPLPAGLRRPREQARVVFDTVAELYDRARPGYPAEAVAALAAAGRIGTGCRVLEIGCGTGQLTRSLAPLGASVRCLEPGPSLAALARRRLAAWPGVEVVTTTFEDADEAPGSYDAVVSATAFHWIDPGVGFPRAARLLRPGGVLALLTNSHAAGGSQEGLAEAIGALHRALAPEVGDWWFPAPAEIDGAARQGRGIAAVWQAIERRFEAAPDVGALFGPPEVRSFAWIATYDRDGYLDMLRSQSSYALMDPARREELMTAVGALVDGRMGGTVTKQYVTVLATAARL